MGFKVIKESILQANDNIASDIKARMDTEKVFVFNLISSPGSGKTSLLEALAPKLNAQGIKFCILTGDCFTTNDAKRLDKAGAPVIQINTGNSCHIDAALIDAALNEVELKGLDLLVVENVGNLVCPAEFDIGEDEKVAVLSVPEGEDKPLKYPLLFSESRLIILNKIDLIKHTDFDLQLCGNNIANVNSKAKVVESSCKTGEGIDGFVEWIKERIETKKGEKRI
ncbi:MAG: hydrogenase nickel incorporation protein HypB [Candidatus Omnitrophota bacterium]